MGGLVRGELLGAGLLVAAFIPVLLWMFVVCRRGTLPRSGIVGIRTWNVLKSERTWTEIHRRYAVIFLVDGLLLGVAALLFFLGGMSFIEPEVVGGQLVWVAVLIIVVTIVSAISAEIHAWILNRQAQPTGDDARVK
ncbi:SdpI family protein [Actinomyces lilanjuaniae]|uniref:SdpI family protein n=1 Tax=Actinomyces lilanjuaniae TaxID=2321394 RepID=A0ABM6Z2Z5_9ACTO|nr:SdpI family protein [Actinomyces lilanjuaniae]AYD89495.1 SdpI family protein [Actinomyces lilanjuaniae]